MLQQAFGDEAMSRTQRMSYTDVLKRAELQVRTVNVQDDLQHKKNEENFQEVGK